MALQQCEAIFLYFICDFFNFPIDKITIIIYNIYVFKKGAKRK